MVSGAKKRPISHHCGTSVSSGASNASSRMNLFKNKWIRESTSDKLHPLLRITGGR